MIVLLLEKCCHFPNVNAQYIFQRLLSQVKEKKKEKKKNRGNVVFTVYLAQDRFDQGEISCLQ